MQGRLFAVDSAELPASGAAVKPLVHFLTKTPAKNSTLDPVKPKRTLLTTSLPRTEVILDLLEAEKAGLVLMGTEDAKSCITRLVSSRWW